MAPAGLARDAREAAMTESLPIAERLLTKRQSAARAAVCERTIGSLIASGKLRCVRIGRAVRIDPRDLEAFIERAKGGRRCG